jgi:exonuclease SbcC
MKIIHTADIHACKEHEAEALKSLDEIEQYQIKNPVDLVAIAADFWDATMQNTDQSGFDRFLGRLSSISSHSPVVMVEGTPSHDVDGSLDVIKRLQSVYGITVLEPGIPYFLNSQRSIQAVQPLVPSVDSKLLILGIPEPRKKYLLANGTAGKGETEEAVRNAMHQLCFQLAAIRKHYADLPCLVVYHGDVAGTTLQNDETVERGTGIAITIDDLADIGADYYALGHIHKPQQVGNLPAYYAGSVYAKNFGESHKPGFNVVELMKDSYDSSDIVKTFWEAKVTRVDFSHPQNLKVKIGFKLKDTEFHDVSSRRVWVEIYCTKEEKAFIDTDAMLARLIQAGAVPGSRVTVVAESIETVRAADIAGESITPTRKLEIWGEQSKVDITDSLKAKLRQLEDKSERSGVIVAGDWALVSVRLRGAIGIWKGVRKDEIFINFDEFDPGLITLSGKNGKGKTTLIENCHPYAQLLTRKGTLKEHFRLKDSFREVIYRDERTGAEKRFLIQIDGATKSGSSKYYIFDRAAGTEEWTPAPGIDGNLAPYEDAVKAVFGPLELYLRTAFITQRPNKDAPDLTEATKGEKKVLFANLAGLDYLQQFADNAKTEADRVAAESHDAEIKIGMLEGAVKDKVSLVGDIILSNEIIKRVGNDIESCKTSGTAAKNRVEKLAIAANAERARAQRANELEASLGRIRQEMDEFNRSIADYEVFAGMRPEYEATIKRYDELKATIDAETEKQRGVETRNQAKINAFRVAMDDFNAQKREIEQKIAELKDIRRDLEKALDAGNAKKLSDYQTALEAFNAKRRTLEQEVVQTERALAKAKADYSQIQGEIRFARSAAPEINEDCPTCGQKLPAAKIAELTRKREEALQRIGTLEVDAEDLNNAIASTEARLEALRADLTSFNEKKPTPEAPDTLPADDPTAKRIEALNLELAGLDYSAPVQEKLETFDPDVYAKATTDLTGIKIDEIRANLTRAAESSVRIEGLRGQITAKSREIVEKQGELDEIIRNANPDALIDLELGQKELADLMEKYRQLTAELASNQASLEAQRKRLTEIEAQETELAALKESVLTAKTEIAEWDLLRRAFGPDGIQALELDALAPGIADVANEILEKSFGTRFRVEFRTTRMAGAGKNTKQVEDFQIIVIDTEDGEETLLENKSGGEAVWIKRAIYSAFAIIRARNTGFRFLTCFQDESDGALDSDAKIAYHAMLEAEHDTAKLKHTIIITHSEEVKAMIAQKIEMTALAEAIGEVKAEEAEFALEAV